MKFLYDFFPILLFFVAYKVYDIYVATAVAIVSSIVQVAWYWARHRRFETLHLVTLVLIIVFGGLTLALHDETFIKWKPTIINWLFAAAFLASQFIGEKNLVQRLMGANVTLPAFVWPRLNLGWVLFFLFLGAANLYVMTYYDTDTWVNFKLFGMMGLTLLFVIGQGFYLMRYLQEPEQAPEQAAKKEESE
jgi:intracellular septation protein